MRNIEYPDLELLFRPKSIAIVGASASEDPTAMAAHPLKHAVEQGYQGKLYPVNPKREEIRGLKCYPSVLDIPGEVDAAVIIVPAAVVANVLRQCAEKGIKMAVILSGGFAEAGEEGKKRQAEIVEIVKETGIRVVGPNCNGLRNVLDRVALGSSPAQAIAFPGRLGCVTQSGGVLSAVVARFADNDVGLTYFVNAGNQADLEVCDYAKFVLDDPNTDVLVMYVEGFKDARKFLDIADLALEKRKPLVIMKVGRSELGAKVARGHTASMVGSDEVFDAVCKQKCITRTDDYDTFTASATAFLKCRLPEGDGVGILPISGGAMAVTVDYIASAGLSIPETSLKTQEEARNMLPNYPASGEMKNPFDVSAAMILEREEVLKEAVKLFARDENFHIIVAVITELPKLDVRYMANALIEAAKVTKKPVIVLSPRGKLHEEEANMLTENNIPILRSTKECAQVITSLTKYSQATKRLGESGEVAEPEVSVNVEEVKKWLKSAGKVLTEYESKELLARYGIATTKEATAKSPEEAVRIAEKIGYPLVLKIDSPDILHKTDAGAIKLNIRNQTELKDAYNEIIANARKYDPKAEIRGALIQEMIEGGREIIVGMSHDAQFGPILAFGLGGVFVEVLKDTSLRVAPLTRKDAEEMVTEIKGYRTLEAFRGYAPADVEGIIDTLLKLSKLSVDLEDVISEIDINPLVVLEKGKGVKAVDALVVLK